MIVEELRAGERERLSKLYNGTILHFRSRPQTEALVAYVWDAVSAAYPESDPREIQRHLGNDIIFERLTELRRSLVTEPRVGPIKELIRDVLVAFDCDLEQTYFDLLRLRAVQSDGARLPETAQAYHLHRDSWYANPPAQINWWLALSDVSEEESFVFYPECFHRRMRNGSHHFDYQRFRELGGWQVPHPAKVYPHLEEEPEGVSLRRACRRGECLRFSGTHLHGTANHRSGRVRYSVEFRTVHLEDLVPVSRRRRLDDRSRGTPLVDHLRASDFTPLPEAVIALYLEAIGQATSDAS